MNHSALWVAVLAGLLACSTVSRASVTRGSPLTGVSTSGFPTVGLFGDTGGFYGSATAIHDGNWVLTARHCVTTDQSIGGSLKPVSQLRFKAEGVVYSATEVHAAFGADLALVRLANSAPAFSDLYHVDLGIELGQTFTAVGYGVTDSNGDEVWGPGGFGTRRQFQNRTDAIQSGSLLGQGSVLRYDFDKLLGDAIGDLEGLAAPGDSGGGAFLSTDTGWLLAGVISSVGSPAHGATGSNVRIADYYAEIMAIVPEPTSVFAIACVTPILMTRRLRRG